MAFGIVHGSRGSLAAWDYYRAKYGAAAGNPSRVMWLCGQSFQRYPWNYHVAILAGETARAMAGESAAEAAGWPALDGRLGDWCRLGLELNPYRIELRFMEAELLWDESPEKGIAAWESYVDWHFWNPANHALLADMYADAGRFEEAVRILDRFVPGAEYAPLRDSIASRARAAGVENP